MFKLLILLNLQLKVLIEFAKIINISLLLSISDIKKSMQLINDCALKSIDSISLRMCM